MQRYEKASKEKYRYSGKESLDLKETINHCDTMAKVKEDEVNADRERATRQVRSHSGYIINYRSSPEAVDRFEGMRTKNK